MRIRFSSFGSGLASTPASDLTSKSVETGLAVLWGAGLPLPLKILGLLDNCEEDRALILEMGDLISMGERKGVESFW